VFCRKFQIPIYCNALTAEAIRFCSLGAHRNWRIFRTGAAFSICDITIETFSVPHDAVEPVGFVFHVGSSALGYMTDLGYATRLTIERLREVQTLVIETNHDEKLLQNDPHRPWPVKQRIQSRHGHLSNAAAAAVIEQLLPGKVARIVLGHLSRDCNSPVLALGAVKAKLERFGRTDVEIFCARQSEISAQFAIGETRGGVFQPTFENMLFETSALSLGAARLA
jgi:phosphoribosyl 1,2-cyclic phosphodiesterase